MRSGEVNGIRLSESIVIIAIIAILIAVLLPAVQQDPEATRRTRTYRGMISRI
jgi:type II secretory pathway pseudopilin PulG